MRLNFLTDKGRNTDIYYLTAAISIKINKLLITIVNVINKIPKFAVVWFTEKDKELKSHI